MAFFLVLSRLWTAGTVRGSARALFTLVMGTARKFALKARQTDAHIRLGLTTEPADAENQEKQLVIFYLSWTNYT